MSDPERRWVVDAIEDGVASLEEDGARIVRVPAWVLPAAVREGDVLRVSRRNEGAAAILRVEVDEEATAAARRRSGEQVARLARNDPGGDIIL